MGTLGGFAWPSAPAPHPASPALRAASPNPPAMVRCRRSQRSVGSPRASASSSTTRSAWSDRLSSPLAGPIGAHTMSTRVLLIDDDARLVEMLGDNLRSRGYLVDVSGDG